MTYEEFKQNFLGEFLNIKSFAGRMKYASQYLTRIGSGSGRVVFDIDGEKVLKLAKNPKGVAQNEAEAGAGRYDDTHSIVTMVFEEANDDTWLISEKGKKVNERRIKELTGIPSLNDLYYYLRNFTSNNSGRGNVFGQDREIVELLNENEWVQELTNFIANYSQSSGDMGRPSTYGEVLRDGQPSIVLTDYGLNDEVYNTYYNPQKKQRYAMYEMYNFADGNDDMLSDIDSGEQVRHGMWALIPYGVGDGDENINEELISYIQNRNKYPERPLPNLPVLTDAFHKCVNNIREVLSHVDNKKQFYSNLLELQDYIISRGFYDREPLSLQEYVISEQEAAVPEVIDSSLTDAAYADQLATAAAEKLNLPAPKRLGGGANGFSYEIDDERVMKLTADVSEGDAASKLLRARPQYLAAVYNLNKLVDTERNKAFFLIIQENVKDKPLNRFRKYNIDIDKVRPNGMDFTDFISQMRIVKKFDYNALVEMAKHMLTDNPEAGVSEPDRQAAYNYLVGLFNIKRELIELHIKSFDYTTIANLGYKNGVLKYFDWGGYSSPEPDMDKNMIIYLPEDGTAKFSTPNSIGQDDFPVYNQNDTSPLTDNNVPTDTEIHEDLEYHHASDATQDKYTIDELVERVLSSMKGSSTVDVKKKCRLAGLGNTSAACNQGDINNLEIKSLDESSIPFGKDYWGWISPDNRLIQVPKLKHMGYIMTQYKNEPFGWDYERVFNKAIEDGWVRITYEYSPQQFLGDLNINGYNKERVVEVFKKFFYDMVKYGNNAIYLEWENPAKEHLRFNTRDSEGKMKLVDFMGEGMLNEVELMSLQELPFKQEVEQLGGKIFSVGGAVRDEFLGKESKDLDVLITGIPMDKLEQLLSKYGRVDAVGKSFGVLKFKPKGATEDIDIAIPRTEKPTGDVGHKAFDVTSDHALPIEKDLERRDFTINAIAKDIDGNIVDPFNGQEDLKNKIIRIVNPEAFSDDPLRMLRAVQFASRFDFTIEPETMRMIQENASRIKEIPPERILTEFDKIVKKGNKLTGAQLLKNTGLFQQIFGFDIQQSTIDRSPFDDVKTMGEFIFLLIRLLSNPAEFYRNNLKGDIDTYKEIKALNIGFSGAETTNPIEARTIAHNMYVTSPQSLQSQILPSAISNAAQELLQGKYPKTIGELAVNGNDLMVLNLKGKEIGDMQKSLLLKIYGDKVRNNREELLNLAGQGTKGIVQEELIYQKLHPDQKDTWQVNGQEVDIHYFLDRYDEWNAGERFRDPSKESVLRFMEDEFEQFVNDENLKREILFKLNLRDLLNEEYMRKPVSYSAVVLDKVSQQKLIGVFKPMIPEGWEILAHHMTIKMGALEDGSQAKQDMLSGVTITLNVENYAIDDMVMAVGVNGYETKNAKAHITLAVNRTAGGKPVMSNKLVDWKELGFPLALTGKVTEV